MTRGRPTRSTPSDDERLAEALMDLTDPASARRAFASSGRIQCREPRDLAPPLVDPNVIERAAIDITRRNPGMRVALATDEDGDPSALAGIWQDWIDDAAAVVAMRRAAAKLGYPVALAPPINRASDVVREWERSIRCAWRELAPVGEPLARQELGAWRRDADVGSGLLHEVLEWAAAEARVPGSFKVCPWGFGEGDADDHASLPEPGSAFDDHLRSCPLCRERVRCSDVAGDRDGEPRVILFPREVPLAADAGDVPWRVEHEVPGLGPLRVWMSADDVLVVAPHAFDGVAAVEALGRSFERDVGEHLFALPLPAGLERAELWQAEITLRLTGGDEVILEHPRSGPP